MKEEAVVAVDPSRRIKVWQSAADLHIQGEDADGRGGWAPGPTLTLPLSDEIPQRLVQAVLKSIGAAN